MVATAAQIGGMILEECLASVIAGAGFRRLAAADDAFALGVARGSTVVHGRGADHEVDVLGDLSLPIAFTHPLRLFVEAKFRGTVDLSTLRNAHATVTDVNEYWWRPRPGHPVTPTPRKHYVYCLFSAGGFTSEAEHYAQTHQLWLQDMRGGGWADLIRVIHTAAATLRAAAIRAVLDAFPMKGTREALRRRLTSRLGDDLGHGDWARSVAAAAGDDQLEAMLGSYGESLREVSRTLDTFLRSDVMETVSWFAGQRPEILLVRRRTPNRSTGTEDSESHRAAGVDLDLWPVGSTEPDGSGDWMVSTADPDGVRHYLVHLSPSQAVDLLASDESPQPAIATLIDDRGSARSFGYRRIPASGGDPAAFHAVASNRARRSATPFEAAALRSDAEVAAASRLEELAPEERDDDYATWTYPQYQLLLARLRRRRRTGWAADFIRQTAVNSGYSTREQAEQAQQERGLTNLQRFTAVAGNAFGDMVDAGEIEYAARRPLWAVYPDRPGWQRALGFRVPPEFVRFERGERH